MLKNLQGHLSAGSKHLQARGQKIYGHLQSFSIAGLSVGEGVKSRGSVSGEAQKGRLIEIHVVRPFVCARTCNLYDSCAFHLTFRYIQTWGEREPAVHGCPAGFYWLIFPSVFSITEDPTCAAWNLFWTFFLNWVFFFFFWLIVFCVSVAG